MFMNKNLQTCFLLSGKAPISAPSVTQNRDPAESRMKPELTQEASCIERPSSLLLLHSEGISGSFTRPAPSLFPPTRPLKVLPVKVYASTAC